VEVALAEFSRSKIGLVGASVRRCAMRTFRARAGGEHFFFRSKFGLVGASVRRCAFAHLPCPEGGGLAFFFRSKIGLAGANVRRCAFAHLPCPEGGGLAGFFPFQDWLGWSKRAPVRICAPS